MFKHKNSEDKHEIKREKTFKNSVRPRFYVVNENSDAYSENGPMCGGGRRYYGSLMYVGGGEGGRR